MKELQLSGSFYEMGCIYGKECKKQISKFAKGAYIMASLSKKPGSLPFNPNLWYILPTLLRQNLHALQRQARMKELLNKYDGEIDREIMETIASDHGVPGTETHEKSLCQHSKGFRYNFKTLVSFIAHPKGKQFWIYEGNPCEKKVKHYDFN